MSVVNRMSPTIFPVRVALTQVFAPTFFLLALVGAASGCRTGSRSAASRDGVGGVPGPVLSPVPALVPPAGSVSPGANWPMPNPPQSGLPNPQSYDTSTPGVVVDKVTGLSWQALANTTGMFWPAARSHCLGLSLGGHDDWRLPSLIELVSLVDFSRTNPAIDGVAFPKPVGGTVWTATPTFPSQEEAWYVSFNTGFTYHGHGSLLAIDVRCVRSGGADPAAGARTSILPGDGVVADKLTGLFWQRTVDATPRSFEDAGRYCAALPGSPGGAGSKPAAWRVPSVKELQTILDLTRQSPALDPATFPGSPGEQYWTSSPLAGSPSEAWSVNFGLGVTNPGPRDSLSFVRCVR